MKLPFPSTLAAAVMLTGALAPMTLCAETPKFETVALKDIDGKDTTLQPHAGKVWLIVNVASQCGHTPQYAGLEALWRKYRAQGLVVLGFPTNDFGEQEPGTNAEIKQFCSSRYEVTFPMFEKIHVKGPDQHPLYTLLTGPTAGFPGDVEWNFGKFLVGRNGKLLARFDSDTEPESAGMMEAIEKALK
jgi:glutathione peroxidase